MTRRLTPIVAALGACGLFAQPVLADQMADLKKVLTTNADIAHALYADSVDTAEDLRAAIDRLIESPTEENLQAAREAWLVAREPYGQSEVYRFRSSPIDDDPTTDAAEDGPEGAVNAWPLGEALIDYVETGGDFTPAEVGVTNHETGVEKPIPPNNLIAATDIAIDSDLLEKTVTAEDERDVLSGYHAAEFLLWGQDLNDEHEVTNRDDRAKAVKTHGAPNLAHGGQRPVTDFDPANCTSGEQAADAVVCERRGEYLKLVADKLIADLTGVRDQWDPKGEDNYYHAFTQPADMNEGNERLLEILTGMGTLSEGELAGERMQIALSVNSQEDEHSCFSDNTHRDIALNAEGIANSFFGEYAGYDSDLDGTDDVDNRAVSGYGIENYLRDHGHGDVADSVSDALARTAEGYSEIDRLAREGQPFDVLIEDIGAERAQPVKETILSLNAQATQIAQIASTLDLGTMEQVVDPEASACDTTNPVAECE
ncbi:MAG: imelysin family protein [Guyparkeria sp.]|uniref:imelysin family protein n=1 Tax=Guyparkeria sp. TaxID=2035736 RepID=UPI003979807B